MVPEATQRVVLLGALGDYDRDHGGAVRTDADPAWVRAQLRKRAEYLRSLGYRLGFDADVTDAVIGEKLARPTT